MINLNITPGSSNTGSGIDVTSIVNQILDSERGPEKLMQAQEERWLVIERSRVNDRMVCQLLIDIQPTTGPRRRIASGPQGRPGGRSGPSPRVWSPAGAARGAAGPGGAVLPAGPGGPPVGSGKGRTSTGRVPASARTPAPRRSAAPLPGCGAEGPATGPLSRENAAHRTARGRGARPPVFTLRAAEGGRVPNPHPMLTGHPLSERPGAASHEGETISF